jgi:hypothetical protein
MEEKGRWLFPSLSLFYLSSSYSIQQQLLSRSLLKIQYSGFHGDSFSSPEQVIWDMASFSCLATANRYSTLLFVKVRKNRRLKKELIITFPNMRSNKARVRIINAKRILEKKKETSKRQESLRK